MPLYLLIGAAQIFFIVHAARTGRPYYWMMIILFVPLLGIAAYVGFELLPGMPMLTRDNLDSMTVDNVVDPAIQATTAAALGIKLTALEWTIFRPSVVFGPEDQFLNLFAMLARFAPVLPIGGANAKFQPVWVADVAAAIVNSVDRATTAGRSYELCGPKVYTLRQLVQFAALAAGHRRPVIALPDVLARLQARLMELMPGKKLLSRDNLDSMRRDSVASQSPYAPAPELGIGMTPMEPEAMLYLAGQHPRSRFSALRAQARR